MRNPGRFVRVLVLTVALLAPGTVLARGLDGFLAEIDVRAQADLGSFKADLAATFGVSRGDVDGLFRISSRPADVYMYLRLGEVARRPVRVVVEEYRRDPGRGWGAIAKDLGIKPGSDEFHALKSGRLTDRDDHGGKGHRGHGSKAPKGSKGRN